MGANNSALRGTPAQFFFLGGGAGRVFFFGWEQHLGQQKIGFAEIVHKSCGDFTGNLVRQSLRVCLTDESFT